MNHLLLPQTQEQAVEFLRIAKLIASEFDVGDEAPGATERQLKELRKEIDDLKHDNELIIAALSAHVNSEDSQG